jgi:hypothetical protein
VCEGSVCMLSDTSIEVMSHCDIHHECSRGTLSSSPRDKMTLSFISMSPRSLSGAGVNLWVLTLCPTERSNKLSLYTIHSCAASAALYVVTVVCTCTVPHAATVVCTYCICDTVRRREVV